MNISMLFGRSYVLGIKRHDIISDSFSYSGFDPSPVSCFSLRISPCNLFCNATKLHNKVSRIKSRILYFPRSDKILSVSPKLKDDISNFLEKKTV